MTRSLLLLCLWSSGCAYKVGITASPSTATIDLPGERGTVVTPAEVVFRWAPFNHQVIRATADGYRPLEIDLRDREIRASRYVTDALFRPATFFGRPRGEVRLVLVPEHGPIGTWSASDVEQ